VAISSRSDATSWLVAGDLEFCELIRVTGDCAWPEAEGHHSPGWLPCWERLQHIPAGGEKMRWERGDHFEISSMGDGPGFERVLITRRAVTKRRPTSPILIIG